MGDPQVPPDDPAGLRRRAEAKAQGRPDLSPEQLQRLSPEEIQRLVHELQVHQIELEMQNEELRRTQASLEESRASYVDLYDLAPVGYCSVDESGRIAKANLTAAVLLGVDRSDLVSNPFVRSVVAEDQDTFHLQHKQFLETGAAQAFEVRLLRTDSSYFWARLEANVTRDAGGMPVYNMVISDITEQMQKDAALARSRTELQAIYDNAPVMMCIVEANLDVLYANRSFMSFMGASAGDLVGGRVGGIVGCIEPRNDPGGCLFGINCEDCRLRQALVDTFTTGLPHFNVEHQTTLQRAGKRRTVTLLASTALLPGTRDPQLLLCLQDITARKQAEEQKERLQAQLAMAQRMESIGRLAAGIAHNFNNHLTVINGYANLLLSQMQPTNPHFHPLTEVLQAGERSADLVRQLLAFSRKQVLRPEVISLDSTVNQLEPMLRLLCGANVELHFRFGAASFPVLADRSQVEQVVLNLVVNACDAMPDGGTLSIETALRPLEGICHWCQAEVRPGAYVELSVRDTGTGMCSEVLEKAFEPFFTTKAVGEGSGLGLSTVQGIALQSGGHVDAESELGKGSVFRVYFPVAEPPAAIASLRQESGTASGTETILLVEDHADVRRLIASTLERHGYLVVEAAGADEALERSKLQRVDLLLTDMEMPKVSGVELARRLSAALPGVKTLFISGYSEDLIDLGREAVPSSKFLQKPFAPDMLALKVREALDHP
ncbi:MAG: PAS domain S-box protein [Acidobacteria bacterium]|nr:PAS domain S-box protein [Acidobacteriota bacterium]